MVRGVLTGLFLLFSLQTFSQVNTDSIIQVLRKEIDQRSIYVDKKVRNIENLQASLRTVSRLTLAQQFDLYNSLYHQFKTFVYDSAFRYSQKLIETAYKIDDKTRIDYARVK